MLFEQKSVMTAPHRATHSMIKLNINEVNKYSFLRYTLDAELRSERCSFIINNHKNKIRNQERASNIKIKAILPLVFGVHWLNRIPLLLWAYSISPLSNPRWSQILSNACRSQIWSNACRSLILSNTCGSLILSKINFE